MQIDEKDIQNLLVNMMLGEKKIKPKFEKKLFYVSSLED